MNEEQIKLLYTNYAKDKGFSDYNEFKTLIGNDDSRKVFFDNTNKELGFKDIEEFDNLIGVKKKVSLPNDFQTIGESIIKPSQVGVGKPLPSTSSSPSNLKSENPINVGRPKNLQEFNQLYGTNYANIKTGEQINPFTADIKTLKENKPLTAVEVMQKNNQVALERLEVKKAKLEKLKALKELKLQEPQLLQKADELSAIIQDQTQPYEIRVAAQTELKGIDETFKNASAEVEKLNDLNEIDKTLTNRINSNEIIRQKRLEKEYSGVQNLIETLPSATVKSLAGMAGIMNTLGFSGDPELLSKEENDLVKEQTREGIKKINEFADTFKTQETPENYKEWFEGDFSAGKLAYLASEAIGQTVPTVAAGFLGGNVMGGAMTAFTGAGLGFNESRDIFKKAGLDDTQSDWAALGMSIPLGLLEKFGLENIISKPIGKKILAETAQEVIEKLGKELTQTSAELIFDTTKKSFAKVLKKYGKDVVESAWKEPITEMSQAALSEVGKQAAEAYTGQDSNADQTTLDYLKETGKDILSEGLSGALGGVGISVVTSALQSRTNPSAYDRALELKDQDLYEDFIAQMQSEVDKGIITPEQMELAANNVKKIQEVDAKIPKNIVGAERRSAAAALIAKKEELETEIEGKDKVLAQPIVEEVKIIDQTLAEIVANKPIEEIEANIEKKQKELNLATTPKVTLSNESKVLFNTMEEGKPLDLEAIEKLSSELYQRYKGINGLKEQKGKRFTDKQIDEQLGKIEEDITLLENAKAKLLETNETEIIIKPAEIIEKTLEEQKVENKNEEKTLEEQKVENKNENAVSEVKTIEEVKTETPKESETVVTPSSDNGSEVSALGSLDKASKGGEDVGITKERERLKTKLEKLEYNIPDSSGKIRLNKDGSFKEYGDYENGVWHKVTDNINFGSIKYDYKKVKELYDTDVKLNDLVNSKLSNDLVYLKEKLGGLKELKKAFKDFSFKQIGSTANLDLGIELFLKQALQFNKLDGVENAIKAVEQSPYKQESEAKVEAEPKENVDKERLRQIELLDTEKKIAQLEKEIRRAPIRGSKGQLSQRQLRTQLKNYKEQLRELKGLKPRKKVTDSVLRISMRNFSTVVKDEALSLDERLIMSAMGNLDANDKDIRTLDGNANLRRQGALLKQGGSSIDQIVTDFISENELDADIAQDFRDTLIDFVHRGDAYEWMNRIKEREATLDPDAIRENEFYDFVYNEAIENDLTDEEISEIELQIIKDNELTQKEYETIRNQFNDNGAEEGISEDKNKTDKSKEEDEKRKSTLEAKVKEAKNAYQIAQGKLTKAKQAAEKAGQEQQNNIFGGKPADALLFGTDLRSLNKKVKERQSEVDKFKENLDKVQLALDSFVPSNQVQLAVEAPSESTIVKNPILKRLNKAFLKIGTEILDNAEQLTAKAKQLSSGSKQEVRYNVIEQSNLNRWIGKNKQYQGSEIQDVKTGEPVVLKVYHGTTNEFYEFDSSVKGNIEGHLGKVNYFTSDYGDAKSNYLSQGADITSRLENLKERILGDLESEVDESLEENEREDKIREVLSENYPDFDSSSLDYNMDLSEVADRVSSSLLLGGEEQVLDLYVKLNNPVVLGNGSTWFETLNISDRDLEIAAQEIADENDITIDEAKDDYEYDIRDRAIENTGYENIAIEALQTALSNNGYDSSKASEILGDNLYDLEIDLNKLEKDLRKAELYDNENGELAGSQVIADFFKELGFDGIILTDVSGRFRNMGLSDSASHIHVFDDYSNQIKLADGQNTTFGDTNDIRYHLNDKGEILGFTHNGKIYLNGEKITAKTTMEEAGHIWINRVKENRSDLYQQGLEKIQGSKYLIEVSNNLSYQKEALKQGEKGSDAYNAYMQEEALAKAIADNGDKFISETRKAGFREWVNAMWKEVAKSFGIQNLKPSEVKALTLDEFAKMAAADVFNKETARNSENQEKLTTPKSTINKEDSKGAEKEVVKAEKIAKAEKSINDIRNKLKEKFKVDLPEGTQTKGFTMNELIDVIADTAIQIAKTGIEINEAIKQAIAYLKDEGDLEGFDETEIESKAKEAVKTDKETDKKEEIRLRNKAADKEGRSVSQWLKNFTEQIVKPQELTDLLDEMKISKTIITNAETIKQAQELLDSYQAEYDKDPSKKDPINRVIDEAKKGELGTAVGQVMTQILFRNTAKEISTALKEGDRQKANFFFDLQAKIVEGYSEQGTDAGRALQVRKLFLDYVMSDPDLAPYYYQKQIQKSNKEAKKNKTSIESANEIIDKIETAKKKAIKKVASNITASVNDEIGKEIEKGISRNATAEKLKQVDDFFDKIVAKFEGADNKTFGTIIPVTPKQMIGFTNAVRKAVKEGVKLQIAIAQISTDLIRKGTDPKVVAEMKRNLLGAKKELSTPKEKTPQQPEREAANAELKAAKKDYNDKQKELKDAQKKFAEFDLEKALEAQAKKIADLKKKEADAQRNRIEATELQRAQLAAKQAEKELEDKRKAEKKQRDEAAKEAIKLDEKLSELETKAEVLREKEKQQALDIAEKENFKRIVKEQEEAKKKRELADKIRIEEKKKLQSDINKWEEKVAKLKAKEQEAIDNDNVKRDLDAAILRQKELEANKKELQKNIDKLTKEVIAAAKKSDQNVIEDIIQAFYSKEEQLQSDLEKMVVEALGVTERESVKIAESIKNQMETELRSKLIKDLEKITKIDEEKAQKAATSEYVNNFINRLTVSKAKKNTIVDKLLQLSMMDVLKTDDIMNLMKNKYGIQDFTLDISTYIKEQARKINEADTQGRKNKEMAELSDKMAELAPLYYNEAMNSLWYGAVLSGFGTQDANITFNIEQVVNSFYRALSLTVFNNLINKGTIADKTKSIGNDLYQMFFRTLYQSANEGKLSVRNIFGSTFTNLIYGLKEGVTSFAETQKALESQTQSEMDYSRYAKWMKPLNYLKYVGRALSSMDLATQDLIKNSWIVPVLREIYAKEGLSPKVIDEKIAQQLTSNANEIKVATNEAINDIFKYDISVKKVGDKYHVMYDNKVVFRTDTEQEANDLKYEAAKKQGLAVKRFAFKRLQTRINEKALLSATHLSQETIMSAAPSGRGTSRIYDIIINLKNRMSTFAKEQEQEARASNKTLTKIGKGQVARIIYAAARIVPFVKMAINLAENFFIKDNPLGYLRAMQIEKAVANPKKKAQERLADFYQSQTQINDLKARAIFGTLAWAIPLLLTSLIGDDDEKEKEEKYLKAETADEIDQLKELEETTGQPMEEGNPYLLVPKDGEVFGSLDFMPPQTKKALENAGLAKEHSCYKGKFPNGKFVSIIADPSKFNYVNTVTNTVAMIKKYVVNNKFDKLSDEDKKNKIEQVILDATLYSLMSFGSFSITKRSKNLIDLARQGKSLDAFAQSAEGLIPELEVANPAILRQTIRYIDGTAREFLTPSKDFTTYLGSKVPILGSFISVYGAEKRRGMFGEEMYSVPAMQQGGISNAYYEMRFGDKNKTEKEMYQFLASKGYNKLKAMPTTLSIMSLDGTKETVITDSERNKLGAEVGQKVLKRLQTEKEYLSKLPNSIVNRYVDKLFNMEFKNAWLVSKGVYTEKQVKERNEEFIESMNTAIEKQKEIAKRDKDNEVTPELKAFRKSLPKNVMDRKIFLARNLRPLTEDQRTAKLKEWGKAGIIDPLDFDYVGEIKQLANQK